MDDKQSLQMAQGHHLSFTDQQGRVLRMTTLCHSYSWQGQMLRHDGECTPENCEVERALVEARDAEALAKIAELYREPFPHVSNKPSTFLRQDWYTRAIQERSADQDDDPVA